jgi:hypothetical protein
VLGLGVGVLEARVAEARPGSAGGPNGSPRRRMELAAQIYLPCSAFGGGRTTGCSSADSRRSDRLHREPHVRSAAVFDLDGASWSSGRAREADDAIVGGPRAEPARIFGIGRR